MKLTLSDNMPVFKASMKQVQSRIAKPAAVQAINRAGREGKSAAVKAAVSSTGMRRAVFSGNKRTSTKARITGAKGKARANRKRLSLVVYVRTEKGVRFSKAFNKGSIKRISSTDRKAFFATMESGKKSLFKRTGAAKRQAKKGRYAGRYATAGPRRGMPILREPITEILLPLHPFATNIIKRSFFMKAQKVLPVEFKKAVNMKLSKLRGA